MPSHTKRERVKRELERLEEATSTEARARDRERFRLRALEDLEAGTGGLVQRAKTGISRRNRINRAALALVKKQQAAQFSDSHQDN